MPYRSILVHACQSELAQARYRLAAAIALAEGAHLTGIALSGALALAYQCGATAAVMPVVPDDFSFLTENAKRNLAAFEDAMHCLGIASVETRLGDESAGTALPLEARYCDLMVIGPTTSPDAVIADNYTLARTVLVHAPCPVLVVPSDTRVTGVPGRPLIAWDGSTEASRAVRAALPLLLRAESVTATSFHPQKYHVDDGAALKHLAAYLGFHGIAVDIVGPTHTANVGHALLSLAEMQAHDLIVMGSFGHSPFLEIVLGGATQTVLTEANIPVLTSN